MNDDELDDKCYDLMAEADRLTFESIAQESDDSLRDKLMKLYDIRKCDNSYTENLKFCINTIKYDNNTVIRDFAVTTINHVHQRAKSTETEAEFMKLSYEYITLFAYIVINQQEPLRLRKACYITLLITGQMLQILMQFQHDADQEKFAQHVDINFLHRAISDPKSVLKNPF